MKLEQQVVSLDLAKQLKEAGYKQEGLWCWIAEEGEEAELCLSEQCSLYENDFIASTVAEFGERLPDNVFTYKWMNEFIAIARNEDNSIINQIVADTEANARAKILCYLIENSLITL